MCIRDSPGTDGALASAIAYVIISEGKHDKAFLDKYVVGFDADTMPESAPANSSYMDYIMGTGCLLYTSRCV